MRLIVLAFILWSSGRVDAQSPGRWIPPSDSLPVAVTDYDALKPMLRPAGDTTYVINFWATWCVPCVQELPYFLALDSAMAGQPFKLILVSLDFRKDYVRRLAPFVRERNLERYVIALDDNRMDYWINDVDPAWSGAIPATLVRRGETGRCYERTFHNLSQLQDIVKPN